MKKILILIFVCIFSLPAFSQSQKTDNDAVQNVITKFFDGMRKGDSSMIASTMSKGVIMQTIAGSGINTKVRTDNSANFLKMVGTPRPEIYDERITFDNVLIDADLASVWTNYKFYVGDKFSHCGVNSFTLVRESGEWKILHIIDTRRKDKCIKPSR